MGCGECSIGKEKKLSKGSISGERSDILWSYQEFWNINYTP
jgi:hypothetical protein